LSNNLFTFYLSRFTHHVSRLEPLLILLLAPFLIFPQPDLTPWLMAVVPLLWLCRWRGQGRLTVRTPLDAPVLIVLAMTVVSTWATFDLARSFAKLCGVFLGIALFYALVNAVRAERGVWIVAGLILAGGAAVAGISLVGAQWGGRKIPLLLPFLLPLYGRLPHLLSGVPRAEEGFSANQVGGALTLFIPLAAALLLYRVAPAMQSDHHSRRSIRLLIALGLAGALILMVFVLLLTQSRLAYLTIVSALLLLGASQGRWPRWAMVIALCAGAGLVAYYGVERVGYAIFGFPNLETMTGDLSWTARVEIWRRAWRVIQDHPLTGIGFDTLYPVMHARYPTFIIPAGSDLAHAHNIFLQVALDLGLAGLAAFVWLLLAFGWMLWQVWQRTTSPAYRALAGGLFFGMLAQMIYGLADAIALGQKPGVFLWACFGLGAALYSIVAPVSSTNRSRITPGNLRLPVSRSGRLVLACLLVALPLIGWGSGKFARARKWLSVIEADLAAVQALTEQGPQAVIPWQPEQLLHVTRSDLLGFQSEFALPLALAPYLGWALGYGADIRAASALLQMSLRLTATGEEILGSLPSSLSSSSPIEGEGLEMTIGALQSARPQLAQALAALDEMRRTRQTMPATQLSPRVAQWGLRFDHMLSLLENGVRGALALPELLGASSPRAYLILIQNEDELRPTGGFISGVARVVLDEGRIVELTFEDSYAVDDLSRPYPAAPLPLYEIMGTELWLFRDSNWSPDFPTSAQVAMVLYWLGHDDVNVDGVVAMDQCALQLFLMALGPLDLEEYPEPVTSENVIQAARDSWAPAGGEGLTDEWWERRKNFMGRLIVAAVHKLQDEPDQVDFVGLGWAALRSLEDRHAFVYLPETGPMTDVFHQAGWDGAIADVRGDYLMAVDANLGFNKVNPYITESLSYTVDLRNPVEPRATLNLTHRHEGTAIDVVCRHESRYDLTYEQMMERCYWDYARIYVPQSSRLLEATTHPVPGSMLLGGEGLTGEAQVLSDEVGKTVFATFLVLEPGAWGETQFVYELPPRVVGLDGSIHRYRLYIQKQGGTGANQAQVVLRLPAGAEVVAASPPPTGRNGDVLLYQLPLQADIELSVDWEEARR
jgi:O-antigen ligase